MYATTSRGFGQSSKPKTGYDMKTLAHDILVVPDSLHINKAQLVGHSIAGDETYEVTMPAEEIRQAFVFSKTGKFLG